MANSRSHADSPAFTLIELLVVISIIALLVSILLPALSGARQAGMQAQCLSNIRQVGMGIQQYCDDHEEYYPPGLWYDAAGWYTTFAAQASYYMNVGPQFPHTQTFNTPDFNNAEHIQGGTWANPVWFCPARTRANEWELDANWSGTSRSYGGYGANGVLMPFWDTTRFYYESKGADGLARRSDNAKVLRPTTTIVSMDNYATQQAPRYHLWLDNVTTTAKFRHFGTVDTDQDTYTVPDTGTCSMVFDDGHADSISEDMVWRGQGLWNWVLKED